jgi:hypothetical protein
MYMLVRIVRPAFLGKRHHAIDRICLLSFATRVGADDLPLIVSYSVQAIHCSHSSHSLARRHESSRSSYYAIFEASTLVDGAR